MILVFQDDWLKRIIFFKFLYGGLDCINEAFKDDKDWLNDIKSRKKVIPVDVGKGTMKEAETTAFQEWILKDL